MGWTSGARYITSSEAAGAYAPRLSALRPTGSLVESFSRYGPLNDAPVLVSGKVSVIALDLPAGLTITSISFLSRNTAAVTPTNQWFGLFNSARQKLALTADDTTTAWAANTLKTLALTAPFVTTYAGLHYIGAMVAAATPPSLLGMNANTSLAFGIAPIINGQAADTGLTTPASCPATLGAIAQQAAMPWAYIN